MSSDFAAEPRPSALSGDTFASLLLSIRGLRNRRAIVAMLACTFAAAFLAGLLFAMAATLGVVGGLLATIVWLVVVATGVNAAGLLQMDDARGISPRSTVDALVYGLMCIPKVVVLALIGLAVQIAVFLAIAALLVVCKIPFLGPLLFVGVLPLSVILAGVAAFGVVLCVVLSLPAIWQGAGITRALGQTLAIVRSRLLDAVLLLAFVGFLAFVAATIVFAVLAMGLMPVLGMSMSIVGAGGFALESLAAMPQGAGGGGHAIAGAIGGALLWAVAGSLVAQVYLLGLARVYLRLTDGLDLSASEAALRATFDEARRRTAELGEAARQATQRDAGASRPAADVAPVAAPAVRSDRPDPEVTVPLGPSATPIGVARPSQGTPPAWAPPAATVNTARPTPDAPPRAPALCSQCLSPVNAEDAFCGVCGHRLK